MGIILTKFFNFLKFSYATPINAISTDTNNNVACQAKLNEWPAYRSAARHLKDICLRSEELFEHNDTKLKRLSTAQQRLSLQTVNIKCTNRDASALINKTKVIERNAQPETKPVIVLKICKHRKAQRSICLEVAGKILFYEKEIEEDRIWQGCNDIFERYAFHVANDVLKDINACEDCCIDKERRDELITEVEALYERSRLPHNERIPFHHRTLLHISKKVQSDLHDIPGVIATYIGADQLVIEIDSSSPMKVPKKIEKCLKRNSVDVDYKIQRVKIQLYTKYEGGEKIFTLDGTRFGTLGGFFECKDKRICAVLSRHVVMNLKSNVIIVGQNTIAKIQSLEHEHPDIAIANVIKKIQEHCETRFLNENFEYVSGKLWSKDVKSLVGQHVFIWGASSKPGKGRIINADKVIIDNVNHIIITDTTEKPFCKEGDSGAIICAEQREGDYIHVVAMVIGQYQNNVKPSQYLALPLKEGLEKLREVYGVEFRLLRES